MTIAPAGEPSLLRIQAFRRVFTAAAASTVGTQVSFLAIPLLAVTVLDATPAQIGILGVLRTVAFAVLGLPAGAWLDRTRRRAVMVVADLARAALLASVPVAWWLGALRMNQLYVVVLVTGVATLFFDVAAQSYLPFVVGRDRLAAANSRLQSWNSVAEVAGPSLAGYLVQLASAPVAVLFDAATYLWSALVLAGIRRREPRPRSAPERRLVNGIAEGVRFVFGHPLLRPIALSGAAVNLFIQVAIVMMPLLFTRVLGLSGAQLGLFFGCGGVGTLLGALTANRLAARFGTVPVVWVLGLAVTPFGVLVAFVGRGPWLWVGAASWLVLFYRIGLDNVLLVSLRQRITPDHLLGRMNATMRFVMTGALAVGAALAGAIGQYADVRTAVRVAAVGLALSWVPRAFSPMRLSRRRPPVRRPRVPTCRPGR